MTRAAKRLSLVVGGGFRACAARPDPARRATRLAQRISALRGEHPPAPVVGVVGAGTLVDAPKELAAGSGLADLVDEWVDTWRV